MSGIWTRIDTSITAWRGASVILGHAYPSVVERVSDVLKDGNVFCHVQRNRDPGWQKKYVP